MISKRISEAIPPQMKIMSMVIHILMHFCSSLQIGGFKACHQIKHDLINGANCFIQYIAGYTVANY